MKIGNLDIKKAFLGSLPLTSKNAYIGNYKVISGDEPGPEPVGINYFYYENADTVDATFSQVNSYGEQTFLYSHSDNVEYSFDKLNWDNLIGQQPETIDFDEIVNTKSGLFIWIRTTASASSSSNTGWDPSNCDIYYSTSMYTFDTKDSASIAVYTGKNKEYTSGSSSYKAYLYYFPDYDVQSNRSLYIAKLNKLFNNTKFVNTSMPGEFTSSKLTLAIDVYVQGYYTTPNGNTTFTSGSLYLPLINIGTKEIEKKALSDVIIKPGQKIYLRSTDETFLWSKADGSTSQILYFVTHDEDKTPVKYNIGGDLYTIVNYEALDNKLGLYGTMMFRNETNLVSAENLVLDAPLHIASGGWNNAYQAMFDGCTGLIKAPKLPVTDLVSNCYSLMFSGCTSLTVAPELPATDLVSNCYSLMFSGCTSLTVAPELPATTLAEGCYYFMFGGCTSLTTAPELQATTLANGCYLYMFYNCTSLTQAPELPATTLVSNCYKNMFGGCKLLNNVTIHISGNWADSWTSNWLSRVAPTGTLYNLGGAIDIPTDSPSGCPSGWTIYISKLNTGDGDQEAPNENGF